MKQSPVYLNDLGLICSLGDDTDEIYRQLTKSSPSGLTTSTQYSDKGSLELGLVTTTLPSLEDCPSSQQTRTNQLLRAAYEKIEDSFLTARQDIAPERIAVIIGTSTSGIENTEIALQQQETAGGVRYEPQNLGNPAHTLAKWANVTGPCYAVSTACTSGAKAIASGRRLLRSGMFDLVIAGGVDSICKLTVNGFASLEAVSDQQCLPFSQNRTGINIGEGAALFLMSRNHGDVCLTGVGESSDAHHISAPDPSGQGAELAINKALIDAQLAATNIDYINLHGTATTQNDKMEATVVNRVFGSSLACSSTKSRTGHTLGAAGAIEAAFCYMLLTRGESELPLHVYDNHYDSELPKVALVTELSSKAKISKTMSNSFAFGGNNISLVMERQR